MKPKEFKLALVQMQVKGGDKAWNIRHGVELISGAALNGVNVPFFQSVWIWAGRILPA